MSGVCLGMSGRCLVDVCWMSGSYLVLEVCVACGLVSD